jgi:hypothetical protein
MSALNAVFEPFLAAKVFRLYYPAFPDTWEEPTLPAFAPAFWHAGGPGA